MSGLTRLTYSWMVRDHGDRERHLARAETHKGIQTPSAQAKQRIHGTRALDEPRERWQALSYSRSLHSTVG